MDDLISRQAAIDTMIRLQTEDIEMYGCAIPEGFDGDRAVEALKALPSVQPERRDCGWTGIEDDYPVSIREVIDITSETGALVTQSRVMELEPYRLPESKTGRWIPCSERLPETHKAGNSFSGIFMQSNPVLVYGVPEYESEYSFNVVTYCDDLNGITYWSTEMDAVTINKVTAWMPMPEPYEEDENEK